MPKRKTIIVIMMIKNNKDKNIIIIHIIVNNYYYYPCDIFTQNSDLLISSVLSYKSPDEGNTFLAYISKFPNTQSNEWKWFKITSSK